MLKLSILCWSTVLKRESANDKPLNRPDVNPKVDYWGGDLAGLQQKIDDGYFETLGVNTLWISPLNQNPTQPYGYYAPMKPSFRLSRLLAGFFL